MKTSEIVTEFDAEHNLTDIILLGEDGAIRRIIIDDEEEDDF